MTSAKPACGICAMIDRIKANSFRDFVAELKSCYVILGDQQFYRGYCVLLGGWRGCGCAGSGARAWGAVRRCAWT